MKTFFSLSLLTFMTSMLYAITEEDFNKAMRELWSDHAVWTREYTVAAVANQPDAPSAAKRLLKNQEDIGNAIIPFYGKRAGKKLTTLLKEHITIAVDLIAAAKKNDTKGFKKIDAKWHKNAVEISTFLSKANPYIPYKSMLDMMNEHLKLTGNQAALRIKKQWAQDVTNYDAIRKQLNGMADELAQAIIKAFPDKFEGAQSEECENAENI